MSQVAVALQPERPCGGPSFGELSGGNWMARSKLRRSSVSRSLLGRASQIESAASAAPSAVHCGRGFSGGSFLITNSALRGVRARARTP
jgi:hypothetical protein